GDVTACEVLSDNASSVTASRKLGICLPSPRCSALSAALGWVIGTITSGVMPPPPSTVRPASVLNVGGFLLLESASLPSDASRLRLLLRPDGVNHSAVVSFAAPPFAS